MRKALIPAFLLVVAAIVLGSTVFREQVVNAATTPFQNVVVTNTSTNPVPVKQIGTSTTSVTGTVGIDPSKNTVKLGSDGNTVQARLQRKYGQPRLDRQRASGEHRERTRPTSRSTAAGTSRRPRRRRRPAR